MVIIKTKADDVRIQAVSPEFMVGGGAAAAKVRAGNRVGDERGGDYCKHHLEDHEGLMRNGGRIAGGLNADPPQAEPG